MLDTAKYVDEIVSQDNSSYSGGWLPALAHLFPEHALHVFMQTFLTFSHVGFCSIVGHIAPSAQLPLCCVYMIDNFANKTQSDFTSCLWLVLCIILISLLCCNLNNVTAAD